MLTESSLAQDDSEAAPEATEQETPDANSDEAEDDSVVDEEFYQDADDEDFVPTEDIPADQSIPFPTDI